MEWTIEVKLNSIQQLNKDLKEGKCKLELNVPEKWDRAIEDWRLDYALFLY